MTTSHAGRIKRGKPVTPDEVKVDEKQAADADAPGETDEELAKVHTPSGIAAKNAMKAEAFAKAELLGLDAEMRIYRAAVRLFTGDSVALAEENLDSKLRGNGQFNSAERAVLKEHLRELAAEDLARIKGEIADSRLKEAPTNVVRTQAPAKAAAPSPLRAQFDALCKELAESPTTRVERPRIAKKNQVDGMQGFSLAAYMVDATLRAAIAFVNAQYKQLQLDERDTLFAAMEQRLGKLGAGDQETQFLMARVKNTAAGIPVRSVPARK